MAQLNTQTLLREHGLRATPQRLALAELLLTKPTHETAQNLHESLKDHFPSMSHNTVYLTLSHFETAGLVRRFYVDGKAVFDSNTTQHDHAYCQDCNRLIDVPENSANNTPAALSGWSINQQTQLFSGICPDCVA